MNFISLFAGIGGFDLGFERAGLQCIAQVEKDPFCRAVLAKHWPDVPKLKDVRDAGKHNLPPSDVVCGGFPCQDASLANTNRQGFDGVRSSLWLEFARIVCELRPRWVVIENVPGLLSANDGAAFATIHRQLFRMGYDAERATLPAAAFGAPHLRKRIFIVAYPIGVRLFSSINEGFFSGISKGEQENFWRKNRQPIRTSSGRIGCIPNPGIFRVDDGFPSGLDKARLKALGNAVVPQIAEWIGRRIIEVEPRHELH